MNRIKITALDGNDIAIEIASTSSNNSLKIIAESEALELGESMYQILEGGIYEYLLSDGYILEEIPGIVSISKLRKTAGQITPNIYVGTLPIRILDVQSLEPVGAFKLEVLSVKTSYRQDYRQMLEEIAEKSAELLMQHSSPVIQSFALDSEKDASTVYQRFAFIKSILDSDEFESAIGRIISGSTTKWQQSLTDKSILSIKRVNRQVIRQFTSANRRIPLPPNHSISAIVSSLPERVTLMIKEETVDTPENRFIKFALETFLSLCSQFSRLTQETRVKKEASILVQKLERHLSHSMFKEVSALTSIPLNSPVLQRKGGYREIYHSWILFDLAAKLVWKGGENVYHGNKRDVAVLYEYWVFFKLIDIITDVFHIRSPRTEELIDLTQDGFGLKIRQGEHLPIKGTTEFGPRKLNVQLSYNRTYTGEQIYPRAGSWSRDMRPDYSLTVWPFGITESKAEEEELIVHMHFDAKYKVEKIQEIFVDDLPLDLEKEEQRRGTYKRADLLKMHVYKDAIRRTAGSYILYPGNDSHQIKKGFHEIIPGLGAFVVRPTTANNGVSELKQFLTHVSLHLMNRASQREEISFRMYETYKNEKSDELYESLPETIGRNRSLVPNETYVLVGYYRKENWEWIIKHGLYNVRAGTSKGSLRLRPQEAGARYIVLHSEKETITSKILKVKEIGPKVFSKESLLKLDYPSPNPQDYYLVYSVEEVNEPEFKGHSWDIRMLDGYKNGRGSALPFAVSLTELMKSMLKG